MMSIISNFIHLHKGGFSLLLRKYGWWIPDRPYLLMMYYIQMGEMLRLKKTKTFSEKLQWLKLYNRKSEYTMMVDKYAVKKYVANIIGWEYIIPTLGVWEKPKEIEWDKLPNQFVLKTTHGGGSKGLIICRDKFGLDIKKTIQQLKKALKQDVYKNYREWPYKNVHKRIIAEKYMENVGVPTDDLTDYKVYCFNGKPLIIMCSNGRFNGNLTFDYYDTEWRKLNLEWDKPNSAHTKSRPKQLDEMLAISKRLSKGIPHIRVDLYIINDNVYFGELTFFDSSGFNHFNPADWNLKLGNEISLPVE